jgi:hypothetical protein
MSLREVYSMNEDQGSVWSAVVLEAWHLVRRLAIAL